MKLTIFTPTYNRAEYLQRTYESLLRQKTRDFIWLIVDDGSLDDTAAVVAQMQKNPHNQFKIEYAYQENQGKPSAFNTGVKLAKTEYFFVIDSDDWLTSNSVAEILMNIEKYRSEKRHIGYVFQCLNPENELLTQRPFPSSPWYGTYDAMIHHQKIVGDAAFVFQTDILKQYPFPHYAPEKFVPEALLYNRLNHFVGNFCYLNVPVKYSEYLPDGLSENMQQLFRDNPHGYYVYALEFLNFFRHGIYQTLRHIAAVGVFGRKIGKTPRIISSELTKVSHQVLYILLLPAIFFYKF